MRGKAFTREVSPRLAECALTHLQRIPIDPIRARFQHRAYEGALQAAELEVLRLPPLPQHPDGVFVEDTALLLDGHAILTRPGAASRATEVESTAAGLVEHFEIHRIAAGRLDGGDVLRIGRRLYVGLSTRSDPEGLADLKRVAGKLGFDVVAAEIRNCLHLKTAATLAGHDTAGRLVLVYNRACVDPSQFTDVEALAVDDEEPRAANVLRIGKRLIMPAGSPKTAARLGERGFDVTNVDISELEKAEAGLSCMSLISEPGAQL